MFSLKNTTNVIFWRLNEQKINKQKSHQNYDLTIAQLITDFI